MAPRLGGVGVLLPLCGGGGALLGLGTDLGGLIGSLDPDDDPTALGEVL